MCILNRIRLIAVFLFLVSFCLCNQTSLFAAEKQKLTTQKNKLQWQAGVAKIKITPKKLIWLSGYGSRNHPAEGKLTDLWAKALVLKDASGRRAVFVTLDLVGIDRQLSQRICARVMKQHQLPRRAIALSTTHTHTGPVVGTNLRAMYFQLNKKQKKDIVDYTIWLEDRIVKVIQQAMKTIKPVKLSWSIGKATFGVNRRNNNESKVPTLRKQGRLVGPTDYDVPVLAVRDPADKLRAVLCGYACHATVLSFYQYSGDWPGFAQIEIEKMYPDMIAMVWAGCGADINPLPRRKVLLAQKYGLQIATAVKDVISGVMKPIDGNLGTSFSTVNLPFARIPTKAELTQTSGSKNRYQASRAKLLLEKLNKNGKLQKHYPYPIQVWKLGNGPTMVIMGGEVVVDYCLRLKHELGANSTWVVAYSNDVMAYIASRRVLREGGYEGASAMIYYGLPSPWSENIERLIIDKTLQLVKEAKANTKDQSKQPNLKNKLGYHQNPLLYTNAKGKPCLITTKKQWQIRRAEILANMQKVMGKLPIRRKLLSTDVKILKREKGEGYERILVSILVEKNDLISAHLYLPNNRKKDEKWPAILALFWPGKKLGFVLKMGFS